MIEFRTALSRGGAIFFDGGMGTLLQEQGMPAGVSPEHFGLERPEAIIAIHRQYLQAGAMVLTTNTFGATHFKLGPDHDVEECNARMAGLAREAAGDKAWVAGSVGPTGHFVKPLGDLEFPELLEAYKAQIRGLVRGGADLILCETHFDLAEVKAAAMAARAVCDLPLGVSMTYEQGVSLTGTPPEVFVDTMQNLGVDFVSTNCGAGPEQLAEVVRAMLPRLGLPVLVQPNAGLPELENGKTVFRLAPVPFAEQTAAMTSLGVRLFGGCCGTTPQHIGALRGAVEGGSLRDPSPAESHWTALTCRSASAVLAPGRACMVIGERINPTGKEQLTKELQEGRLDTALSFATEQARDGAGVLDVNVGAPMVQEPELLPALTRALVERSHLPLCFDSTDPKAIAAALDAYPASALVNSISGEPGRMDDLGPLCKAHGAPFILLPLAGKKLPVTAAERIAIIEDLLERARALGIPKRLVMVDVLALTVSSKPEAAKACLETIRHCREVLDLPTVIGLSNISFGLPARELLNATFLSMAVAYGLSACIANPGLSRLRESLAAGEVLLNRDPQAERFIRRYADWKPTAQGEARSASETGPTKAENLHDAVVRGDREGITALLDTELDAGARPYDLINDQLIPAITEVGDKYEKREYFLPQLLLSAETMQTAFEHLKPLLEKDDTGRSKPVMIMATVEGDIHDIGKNIVILMLRNHGFDVVDLGKDVPAADIVAAAEEHDAAVIGLSALMTTTMVKMEETVTLARERGLRAKVMVGGAVVSKAFAERIGAHGYADDAVSAVRVAKEFIQ